SPVGSAPPRRGASAPLQDRASCAPASSREALPVPWIVSDLRTRRAERTGEPHAGHPPAAADATASSATAGASSGSLPGWGGCGAREGQGLHAPIADRPAGRALAACILNHGVRSVAGARA